MEQLATAPVVPPSRTSQGELHVRNEVKGARPFAQLRADAPVLDLDGTQVPIVSLADLRAMKRAFGRRRDLADVAILDPPHG